MTLVDRGVVGSYNDSLLFGPTHLPVVHHLQHGLDSHLLGQPARSLGGDRDAGGVGHLLLDQHLQLVPLPSSSKGFGDDC